MGSSKKAILQTLIYSDLFDSPLRFEQVYTFLLSSKPYPKEVIKKQIGQIPQVQKKDTYFFLVGREKLRVLRKKREQYSYEKKEKAKKIAKIISFLPTIFFVGISGGVAIENADKDDDIDFFILTKKGTVWITRLCVVLILFSLGVLRTRSTKNISDRICVNMLLDETAIAIDIKLQDIYCAHEIVQLVPLYQRKNMYDTFIQANTWILQYMPHAFYIEQRVENYPARSFFDSFLSFLLSLPIVETTARIIQKSVMKGHRTKETVSSSVLAFHPIDFRAKTLRAYKRKIQEYETL